MDLSKIITVTGKSGLFRILANGRQALIVEALADGKRMAVPHTQRVSALEEISMFTTGDDVPLSEILTKLHELEKGGPSIDPQEDPGKLFAKLGEVLPNHDRERIYASDVRKLFTWYGQLLQAGEFTRKEEAKKEEAEKPKTAKAEGEGRKPKGEVPKKAAAPKPAGSSKAKATTMRKSAQRGS
jgi:hypothetical protein